MVRLLCLAICLTLALAEYRRYDGYQVLKLDVKNDRDLEIVGKLENDIELDFWKYPSDLMVPPGKMDGITSYLNNNGIMYNVMMENVQDVLDANAPAQAPGINVIDQWIKDMATAYPLIADVVYIGESYELRPMRALKLGVNADASAIWFEGGLHAREWIAPVTVMYIAEQLAKEYDTDLTFLNTFEFYFLPTINPDGYAFTWTDVSASSSTDPCSQEYRGDFPESEVEIAKTTDFITLASASQRFTMFIDFHSYGLMWMCPWAYTTELPPDYDDQCNCAEAGAMAIEAYSGTQYLYGNHLKLVSGAAYDWAYGGPVNIKYSYAIELPDRENGFLVPAEDIIPIGEETYRGVKASINCIVNTEPYVP
ncbi:carboxypeptidase B-like [Saccoglossus kowalevskii]